jgi:hypothetical protein
MRKPLTIRILIIASAIIPLIALILTEKNWLFSGEMWAEMITNYFDRSLSSDPRIWLLSTDSGYIPLTQRLISKAVNISLINIECIPYIYTWIAILLSIMGWSAFALPYFRPIIKSDYARAAICILIGSCQDFESRTFINFTYIYAWLATISSLREIYTDEKQPGKSLKFLPLALISKPGVLASLPLIIIAGLKKGGETKRIAIYSIIAASAQILQIKISQSTGLSPFHNSNEEIIKNLFIGICYGFGYIIHIAILPFNNAIKVNTFGTEWLFPTTGFAICAYIAFRHITSRGQQHPPYILIAGVLLSCGNMVLNKIALPMDWPNDFSKLHDHILYRHTIISFWGAILFYIGLFKIIWPKISGSRSIKIIIFSTYSIAYLAWLSIGIQVSKTPPAPLLGSSEWQQYSKLTQKFNEWPCMTVNPYAWGVYGNNCFKLNIGDALSAPWGFETPSTEASIPVPPAAKDHFIHSVSVFIRTKKSGIEIFATSTTSDGITLSGTKTSNQYGTSITLRTRNQSPIRDDQITIHFSAPVEILSIQTNQNTGKILPIWIANATATK